MSRVRHYYLIFKKSLIFLNFVKFKITYKKFCFYFYEFRFVNRRVGEMLTGVPYSKIKYY